MITEARSIIVTAMVLGLSLALVNHLAQPQVVEAQQAFEMKQLKAIVGDQFDIQRTDKNLYLYFATVGPSASFSKSQP